MISVDLTPEQRTRIEAATAIRQATHHRNDYVDLWHDSRDRSIICGNWNNDSFHDRHSADSADTLLDRLLAEYKGKNADNFLQTFASNYPALVQLKEFCEANIAGFKADLASLYVYHNVRGEYRTTSGKVRADIQLVFQEQGNDFAHTDDSPSQKVKIYVRQTNNSHWENGTISYYRDTQELADLAMILLVQAKVMGLAVDEG